MAKAATASSFRLSEGIEKYSPNEEKLFKLLPKNGKSINSTELMDKFYNGKLKSMPVNGRTSMNVSLKRLMLKVRRNGEPFAVVRSKRKGQGPIEWSVQAR
jgi:hypothetical protein